MLNDIKINQSDKNAIKKHEATVLNLVKADFAEFKKKK